MKQAIIYLAAGNSRRFGKNKLFFNLEGQPMYWHLLKRLAAVASRHEGWTVYVVTQYERLLEELEEHLGYSGHSEYPGYLEHSGCSGMERFSGFPVKGVFCPESKDGISFTIKAGVRAADADGAKAYAFFVADQPYLTEETAERFLEAMERQAENGTDATGCWTKMQTGLGCVICGGETGNPTWFSSCYREELLSLEGDRGGKRIILAHPEDVVYFEVEKERELTDLDEDPRKVVHKAIHSD